MTRTDPHDAYSPRDLLWQRIMLYTVVLFVAGLTTATVASALGGSGGILAGVWFFSYVCIGGAMVGVVLVFGCARHKQTLRR